MRMWRLGLAAIATLTILLDLLVPPQLWVSQTCCARSVQFSPPTRVDCPMSTPPGLESGVGSRVLGPDCWHALRYPLRSGAAQAVPLPPAVALPTLPIAIDIRWRAPTRSAAIVHASTATVLPPIAGPPISARPVALHTQLNL